MRRVACFAVLWVASLGLLRAQESARPAPASAPAPVPEAQPVPPPDTGPEGARPAAGAERGWRREPGQQAPLPAAFMERLRQEHPELHERLSKLYREDRQQFFQEVRTLMRERGMQVPEGQNFGGRDRRESPEEQKCQELSRLYQQTKDAAAQERIKGELTEAIRVAFEARLKGSQERIARLEKQLGEFRQHLERMEANREKVCAERLEELTKPAELRWNGNW